MSTFSRSMRRPARVIAPDSTESGGVSGSSFAPGSATSSERTRRARGFDYAALVRRDSDPEHGALADSNANPFALEDDERDADQHRAPDRTTVAGRVGAGSAPVIEAVYMQQQGFIELAASIAREVARLSANRFVAESGSWELTMRLDPNLLADTVLNLTLSLAGLSLRFDVQDAQAKQLLLLHSGMLERQLKALLDSWSEPRSLTLTIW
ncbi:type III secretion system protein SctP [Paraburkholderia caledonica]|uniref:Type III secretion control protein HpaP n=1 Tax=Paraburkholderia caledonica TaxID=134536 RepID=A0AB73IMX7_9BURK|nr:type III secretion control protein HpaP [Paraburkholderia caledonica]